LFFDFNDLSAAVIDFAAAVADLAVFPVDCGRTPHFLPTEVGNALCGGDRDAAIAAAERQA
jgi:hypothetical protein